VNHEGTFARLPDGSWGACVKGSKPKPGATVKLRRVGGTSREAEVYEVLEETPYGWLCSLAYVGRDDPEHPDPEADDYGLSWEDFNE